MKSISLEKILVAKRHAMGLYFNVICPFDDDDGYDRFLSFSSSEEMVASEEWGEIALQEASTSFSLEQLQKLVRSEAIRTLCVFLDITPDVAATALARTKTLGPGARGVYTRCRYDGVIFE
ncbi:hypothetical protein WS58_16550 [Burkholderia pseudomultivorans]|uniref:hypothetical protein n=1 Tax=Burkholderia pseudomultivorans TaxID=1207504 RepID=UPI000757A384|nr:hypothetical protein [Burkholderia pseudomultivorans]AOI94146.1 hypothetical protein WS57_35125 [Burkholderia pseudomultivorans]KVC27775.1 hypothetical protein WS55_12920 [Burkholderia pseudomultivorans]KVC36897.1 hypothetical protein WS56_00290 [Burkholderia pseudomultivorans]KVC42138.1 hypothetical protein WS58_16550 [Burkholderia pseudomultivorans]